MNDLKILLAIEVEVWRRHTLVTEPVKRQKNTDGVEYGSNSPIWSFKSRKDPPSHQKRTAGGSKTNGGTKLRGERITGGGGNERCDC